MPAIFVVWDRLIFFFFFLRLQTFKDKAINICNLWLDGELYYWIQGQVLAESGNSDNFVSPAFPPPLRREGATTPKT